MAFFFFVENKKAGKVSKGRKKVSWPYSQVRYTHCWNKVRNRLPALEEAHKIQ